MNLQISPVASVSLLGPEGEMIQDIHDIARLLRLDGSRYILVSRTCKLSAIIRLYVTLDELNKLCAAIWAKEIKFDYFDRIVRMIITPIYGFDESIKGKLFKIRFFDCIYVCSASASKLAYEGHTEFVSWGKNRNCGCQENACNLLDGLLSRTTSNNFRNFGFSRADIRQYEHYFFQNVLGGAVDILCTRAELIEITEKPKK